MPAQECVDRVSPPCSPEGPEVASPEDMGSSPVMGDTPPGVYRVLEDIPQHHSTPLSSSTQSNTPTTNYPAGSKPEIERRRRARINEHLSELKLLMLENCQPGRLSKVDKAELLELSVSYLQRQKEKQHVISPPSRTDFYQLGAGECVWSVHQFLSQCPDITPDMRSRLLSHMTSWMTSNVENRPPSEGSYPGYNKSMSALGRLPGHVLSPISTTAWTTPNRNYQQAAKPFIPLGHMTPPSPVTSLSTNMASDSMLPGHLPHIAPHLSHSSPITSYNTDHMMTHCKNTTKKAGKIRHRRQALVSHPYLHPNRADINMSPSVRIHTPVATRVPASVPTMLPMSVPISTESLRPTRTTPSSSRTAPVNSGLGPYQNPHSNLPARVFQDENNNNVL